MDGYDTGEWTDVLGQEDIPGLGRAPEDPFNAAAKRCFILIKRVEERFKGMGLRFDFACSDARISWSGQDECFYMGLTNDEGLAWYSVQQLAKKDPMAASRLLLYTERLERDALAAKERNIKTLAIAAAAAAEWLGEDDE